MSTNDHDADRHDHDDEPNETVLADPDEYHRRQRLKEIHQARQEVHKKLRSFENADKLSKGRSQRQQLASAVSMYITELEPLIHDTDADISLPDWWPYDDILDYADVLGTIPKEFHHDTMPDKLKYTPLHNSVQVFRMCNSILSDVKPLIEEDENTEWEI